MEKKDLLHYLHAVIELESAAKFCRDTDHQLYKKKLAAERRLEYLHVNTLNLPQAQKPSRPVEPQGREWTSVFFSTENLFSSLLVGGMLGGTIVPCLFAYSVDEAFGLLKLWFWGILLFWPFMKYIFAMKTVKSELKDALYEYENTIMPYYSASLDRYQTIIAQHEQQKKIYTEACQTNELIRNKVTEEIKYYENYRLHIDNALSEINNKLNTLYSQEIIYPKYRNLVALSYIKDYLESGITNELTGPAGAYAQFENDARADRICSNIDELRKSVERGFANVLQAQSQIYQVLFEMKGSLDQIQRSVEHIYSAVDQSADMLSNLLRHEQEYSERTSQQLTRIRQSAEITANNTAIIAFNQYISAKMRGGEAFYSINRY